MSVGIRPVTLLVVLVMGLGLLVAGCGSGGDSSQQSGDPAATGTQRSERAERQASIMQQQDQADAGQADQEDVSSEDDSDLEATELGEIDFGHRKGLPFVRNVVGEPDAPVVIVEYSDFQ